MAALIRAHDWSATPLGAIGTWPQSLRTAVDLCLSSTQPAFISWGPDLIHIYNDAAIPARAHRHPACLGAPLPEVFAEARGVLEPVIQQVLATGETVKDAACTFSHMPLRDESGRIAGVYTVAMEGTDTVFRGLFDSGAFGMAQIDGSGRFIAVNDRYCEMTGYSRAELLAGMGPVGLDHPDDRGATQDRHRRLSRMESPFYDYEKRFIRKDGTVIWLRGSVTLVRDMSGEPLMAAIVKDITEQKIAEARLADSEERLRLATEAGHIGTFTIDPEAGIACYSPELARILGVPDVTQARVEDAFARVHRDDAARVRSLYVAALDGLGEDRLEMEFRFVRPGGEVRWIAWTARVHFSGQGANRRAQRVVGVCLDLTERKRIETALVDEKSAIAMQLAAIVASSEDAMISAATDGVVTTWNAAAERMFGFTAKEMIGASLGSICPPDLAQEPMSVMERLAAGERPAPYETTRLGKDGRSIDVLISVSALRDSSNRLVGASSVVRDITERKRAEKALSEAREAMARSQHMDALGKLTGGVAHDFNNLLMIVQGNLEMVEDSMEDPRARARIQVALDAVERGAKLTRQLLSFARRRRLSPERTDVNARLLDTSAMIRQTIGEHIEVTEALSPDLWPVMIDVSEFENVLLNLAVNARDAMPRGGTLRIATDNVSFATLEPGHDPEAKPGDYVRVTVSDTGHGMTPEVLQRAMEPFFTTKEVGKGTGLGLSGAHGFARQSGGFLTLASAVGRGTTVAVHLPRAVEAVATPEASDPDSGGPQANQSRLILVVEDDDDVRGVTERRLESLGYRVVAARSGREAIDICEAGHPISLVFSDVVMPGGLSGYDVADWIRVNRPDVRVLLTSGYNDELVDDIPKLRSLKMLPKPYSRAQLAIAVEEAMAEPRPH